MRVISVSENINRAHSELRRKHSQEAYNLWANYRATGDEPTSLPDVNGLLLLNLSNNITGGKPIDKTLKRNHLRPLVGKLEQTLFSDQVINNIALHVQEAVNNGTLNLVPNHKTEENSIEIKYTFPQPFAQVSRKQKNAPPPPPTALVDKNEMVIVLGVDDYIEALKLSKAALNNPNLKGKITSIH